MKFKSQFRRTQPVLVQHVDETLVRSIKDAGGKITGDRFVISAVFNENTLGFWLDMFILVENMKKILEGSLELFGYSLLISSKPPDSVELLCRFLANRSGVFMDRDAAKKMLPYASFEKPGEWLKKIKTQKYGCRKFYRIRDLKTFRIFERNDHNLHYSIINTFKKENKNTLIIGPFFMNIREGLNKYYTALNGDFPRLSICFECIGIGALVDVWSPSIRSLADGKTVREIDDLWDFLFRERLRDEVSEYVARCVKQFLLLVFYFYIDTAVKKKQIPVLSLENIHLAEKNTMCLLLEAITEINQANRQKLRILGTGEDSVSQDIPGRWESIFESTAVIKDIKLESIRFPKLSCDLWEFIYAISQFNRYFSPELIHRLFEEDNKNPSMINRALSILFSFGIIDNLREPRLMNKNFEEYACKILNSRTSRVKALICGRLLDWAVKRNINPCFRLLTIIAETDGVKQINDLLLLKSISYDIVNKTFSAAEAAMNNGQFEGMFGEKAAAVRNVFNTSKALICGNEKDIESVFNDTQFENLISVCANFPIFKTQLIVNLCGYYLGRHDEKNATKKAKEAIVLGQNEGSFCLPQVYRLFSLACLSRQQVNETIEYLGFSLDSAEKSGNYHELAVSAYYAAAAQFLHGDVYNAARLAKKSIEQSLFAGRPDWADRSRFLEGRIEFDLGHYSKALKIFENIIESPFGSMNAEKEKFFTAWVYRCKMYLMDMKTQKPADANHDAHLFEVEAAYLRSDYKKAVELSSQLAQSFSSKDFLYKYTEQADWRSGFAQCEHLYFTNGEIQSRMISVFNSLSLSRLSSQDAPNAKEEAIQNIQAILRDERLCEMDPWDAFYFYAKYRILEQSGASQVDMSTAVSMAFKRLQRRAGRIDDIETRRQYLNGSRWNRELSIAAKEFKLI